MLVNTVLIVNCESYFKEFCGVFKVQTKMSNYAKTFACRNIYYYCLQNF